MFKMLEKLINEHGSAKILKERLGLKDDQINALKLEFSSLTQENSNLKTKNKNLETSLDQANQEIDRLNEIIQSLQKKQGIEKLNEVTEQILQKFFKTGKELTVCHFDLFLGLDTSTVEYHFDILLEKEFIQLATYGQPGNPLIDARVGGDSSTQDTFQITSKGRKYIVENNLT